MERWLIVVAGGRSLGRGVTAWPGRQHDDARPKVTVQRVDTVFIHSVNIKQQSHVGRLRRYEVNRTTVWMLVNGPGGHSDESHPRLVGFQRQRGHRHP